MASQAPNIPILKPEPTVLPPAVLENLAARFRPGGLFLVVFALTDAPDHGWLANRGPGLALGVVTVWSRSWPISPVTTVFFQTLC